MLIRRLLHAVLCAVAAAALATGGAMTRPAIATDLGATDGDSGEVHCHDADYPVLRCFAEERERDAAVAAALAGPLLLGSGTYVVAYTHSGYGGSSITLTQDHGNLSFIGWNDTISSYRVYTSGTGYWHTDAWYSGRVQSYCCFTHVQYVGDAFNDTFSSLDLP